MGQYLLDRQYVWSPLVLTDTDLEVWRIYTYFPAFYPAPLFIEYPSAFYPQRWFLPLDLGLTQIRQMVGSVVSMGFHIHNMDGWMDGVMNGWMDGWMEGWMDGWMDR